MPLVAAICKQCGGELQVDYQNKEFKCPYCNISFFHEQTIYNVNIDAKDMKNVERDELWEKASHYYLNLKRYKEAYDLYKKYVELAPRDYRGWNILYDLVPKAFGISRLNDLRLQKDYISNALRTAVSLGADDNIITVFSKKSDETDTTLKFCEEQTKIHRETIAMRESAALQLEEETNTVRLYQSRVRSCQGMKRKSIWWMIVLVILEVIAIVLQVGKMVSCVGGCVSTLCTTGSAGGTFGTTSEVLLFFGTVIMLPISFILLNQIDKNRAINREVKAAEEELKSIQEPLHTAEVNAASYQKIVDDADKILAQTTAYLFNYTQN